MSLLLGAILLWGYYKLDNQLLEWYPWPLRIWSFAMIPLWWVVFLFDHYCFVRTVFEILEGK